MSATIVRQLAAAGAAAGVDAEARVLEQLAVRVAAEFAGSDIDVVAADDAALRLRGRALRVRAFGSRHRAPDARFAGLAATLARGEQR